MTGSISAYDKEPRQVPARPRSTSISPRISASRARPAPTAARKPASACNGITRPVAADTPSSAFSLYRQRTPNLEHRLPLSCACQFHFYRTLTCCLGTRIVLMERRPPGNCDRDRSLLPITLLVLLTSALAQL